MTEKDPELIGVFEASIGEAEHGSGYPEETEFVRIEYDADGYYTVTCLDGNKEQISDEKFDGHRPEHRIRGALESKPKGKYNLLV